MKDKFIKFYMDIAQRTAELSNARRLKVGCIIVKNDSIISFGYNGTYTGEDNNCEVETRVDDANLYNQLTKHTNRLNHIDFSTNLPFHYGNNVYLKRVESGEYGETTQFYRLDTKPNVYHAEENALGKLLHDGVSADGSSFFMTHSPCYTCAKLILRAGVEHLYYQDKYRTSEGIEHLIKHGVKVEFLP